MTDGYIKGDTVVCIEHWAVFDVFTGKGVAGHTERPLPVYEVRVDGEDVQVRLNR